MWRGEGEVGACRNYYTSVSWILLDSAGHPYRTWYSYFQSANKITFYWSDTVFKTQFPKDNKGQTERPTDRETNKQTNKHRNEQRNRQKNKQNITTQQLTTTSRPKHRSEDIPPNEPQSGGLSHPPRSLTAQSPPQRWLKPPSQPPPFRPARNGRNRRPRG